MSNLQSTPVFPAGQASEEADGATGGGGGDGKSKGDCARAVEPISARARIDRTMNARFTIEFSKLFTKRSPMQHTPHKSYRLHGSKVLTTYLLVNAMILKNADILTEYYHNVN